MFDFTDKVILLTGAGVGIGASAAKAYARDRAKVAVNSVSGSGKKLTEEIEKESGKALFVQGDVSKPEEVESMIKATVKDGIRVNVVSPGTVLSPSLEQRIQSEPDPQAAMNNYVSRQPLGRLGRPEEIATAILFASSEEAGFLDGANICIDGAGSL